MCHALLCYCLPVLHVKMLRSEDSGVHYEAVGVLGNLVHSSQEIKQQVLQVGVSSAWLLLPGPQQGWGVLGWGVWWSGAILGFMLVCKSRCPWLWIMHNTVCRTKNAGSILVDLLDICRLLLLLPPPLPPSMLHVQEHALQPVINLLSSPCPESQREAALLLGQFATQTPNDDGPGETICCAARLCFAPVSHLLAAAAWRH